ncbi:SPOR domain-containing protein [Legionella tunisiensis]|uniref:SPOR domain-containing protein n=1 Tax=Legionella tunisiensis TaxID=1034944 RepID=UPI0002EC2684|nr:SPOR domain-containing protein [Legionella tunisiensis]
MAPVKAVGSPSSPVAIASTPTPAAANQQTQTPAVVTESKPVTVASTNSKESYLLQLASFKNKQEAERLKAALTLKGFDVHVAMSSQQQGNWFRVILGPFHSRGDAEKARMSIARSERITGMIRKMDV